MFAIKQIAEDQERLMGLKFKHFEIGDSTFDAPISVKKACIKAIKENKTHYVDSKGLYELRKKISDKECVDIEKVLICPANFAIFASLSVLCNKGDTVTIPNPYFPTYKAVAKYLGLKIGKKGKVTIMNSPNNPTGQYSKHIKAEDWLIEDNVYHELAYDSGIVLSSSCDLGRRIKICSFSKSHAMSGFRLGYMIAPSEVIDKVALLVETTVSCFPEFIQWAGLAALDSETHMRKLMESRDLMYEKLKNHYDVKKPQGGIYFWVPVKDDLKEFNKLLEKGIVVCPGRIFGRKNYIRFCFAKSPEEIKGLNL